MHYLVSHMCQNWRNLKQCWNGYNRRSFFRLSKLIEYSWGDGLVIYDFHLSLRKWVLGRDREILVTCLKISLDRLMSSRLSEKLCLKANKHNNKGKFCRKHWTMTSGFHINTYRHMYKKTLTHSSVPTGTLILTFEYMLTYRPYS